MHQTEVDEEVVLDYLQVVEDEVQDCALEVPKQEASGEFLDNLVFKGDVAEVGEYHKKGNYHDKYIPHRGKSTSVRKEDTQSHNNDPSKDKDVLKRAIRLGKTVSRLKLYRHIAELDLDAQSYHHEKHQEYHGKEKELESLLDLWVAMDI